MGAAVHAGRYHALVHLVVTLLAVVAQARADVNVCEEGVTTVTVERALMDAEVAWGRMDVPGFRAAAEDARRMLPCLSDALYPSTAARYHRMRGMLAFVERDQAEARRDFAAARALEPAWRFPESIAPDGHPVLEDYTALALDGARYQRVAPPARGRITFDGLPTSLRARDWPTVVQVFDADGGVATTRWLRPTDALPVYEPGPPTPDSLARGGRAPSVPLLAAAGVGLVASGALGVVAYDAWGQEGFAGRAVGLGAAALGAGVAGTALAVVGGRW